MDFNNNIYLYQSISDGEYYFSTKEDIKYDIYFFEKKNVPIDRIQLLYNPNLKVVEFGFDRYYEKKARYDEKIFKTIIYIFNSYPKENKLLYSYVFNPTGKNFELSKLYELMIKHVIINHVRTVSVNIKTCVNYFMYYVYYDDRLNMKFDDFILELISIVKFVYSGNTILSIKIKDTLSNKMLFEG